MEVRVSQIVSAFVCGVQKGGTTSLFEYLRAHPDLAAPNRKELHFFDNETIDWRQPDYGLLDSAFPPADARLRFEATPISIFWPPAMARIRAYNPKAQLIVLFRDPYERAWSHWCMNYAGGREHMMFAESIREGRARLPADAPLARAWREFSYVERGYYASQVRRALAHFPAEQLLFLRSQDLAEDQDATLARVASFLGLNGFPPMAAKRACERPKMTWPCHPSEADHALISGLLAQELEAFADLTGIDVSGWPAMKPASSAASAIGALAGACAPQARWRSQDSGRQ
ncbi:sulfotransferase domain-containing protein [Roseixanthobacter liquoris]|uniref:sulfotransferase domain-containing protein n=1 Tax=Roseixanthobacter liquoris TaxID=3119921 RepID=UPI0037284ACA